MKVTRFLSFLLLAFLSISVHGAQVDTVETHSLAMNKKIKAVVITPKGYPSGQGLPVVYLLHGYSGSYADWSEKSAEVIGELADQNNFIVVCPDGGFSSWYYDSPMDPKVKYETYVSRELVSWIDKNYKTIKHPSGRAITGLSMGGHGALYLALRHQDVFGGAGSMSGGVDIRPFPNNWDLPKRLGTYATSPQNWENHTVINMLHLFTPKALAIIIDCGTSDFFYPVNVRLHEKMLERNIPHDFISRPGGHTWDYWNNAVTYQLMFFSRYFRQASKVQG